MAKLKSCPFCGDEADLYRQNGKNGYFVYVKCSLCGAQTNTFFDGYEQNADWHSLAVERARTAWNRRKGRDENAEPDS